LIRHRGPAGVTGPLDLLAKLQREEVEAAVARNTSGAHRERVLARPPVR
jgi:hypothetical protein